MQVTLGIGSIPEEGFLFASENRPIDFCHTNNTAMPAVKAYKTRFHESGTKFKYENLDDPEDLEGAGFGRVACLIDSLLRQDAVDSEEGLQRLSAEVVLKNPSIYPEEMLSNQEHVSPILKNKIDQTAAELKRGGIIR